MSGKCLATQLALQMNSTKYAKNVLTVKLKIEVDVYNTAAG